MSAFLKFSGTRGHDHNDALGLVWFANGKEVFSETGYRPTNEEFARDWSASTASHLSAAINEQQHFAERDAVQVGKPLTTFLSQPASNGGTVPLDAAHPGAARFKNQGRLLLWNATHQEVQAMEAEQPNCYPGIASLFRRTIVLIPFNKQEGYLVDLFRLRGGKTHDFFLRGGLDHPYTLQILDAHAEKPLPLTPRDGKLYDYLQISGEARSKEPILFEALYPDHSRVRSTLAGVAGTARPFQQAFLATAPAIRRAGNATFSIIRRQSETSAALESGFAWVHESVGQQTSAPRIKNVTLHHEGLNLAVVIDFEDHRDIILSTLDDNTTFRFEGWELHGKLAFIREEKGAAASSQPDGIDSILLAGQSLKKGERLQTAPAPLQGQVIATQHGGDDATLLIKLDTPFNAPSPGSYHVAHLGFGSHYRLSIPITAHRVDEEGNLALQLEYAPGFTIKGNHCLLENYPGWNVAGPCQVTLE